MNHFERMKACVLGAEIDQVPVSMWRHFPKADQTAEGLAQSTIEWQNLYNFDFIKVSPASSFCLKDWGAKDVYLDNPRGIRQYTNKVIQRPDDWFFLPVLNPEVGYLGQQLKCLRIILQAIKSRAPVIQTIFSPLLQMQNLAGKETLLTHLKSYPEAIHAGLRIVSETTALFIKSALSIGIDGIFYAIQHAGVDVVDSNEYSIFGRPYDLYILESANQKWLNILHLHGNNIEILKFLDYPVSILSAHNLHEEVPLNHIHRLFKGAVCGGLQRQEVLAEGTSTDVCAQAQSAIECTQSFRFILGAECGLLLATPHENIMAAITSVRNS